MQDRFRNRRELYIRPSSMAERERLVDYLESKGYSYNGFMDRDDVLTSFLPVVADLKDKVIRRMGNVTVAACAAQSKVLLTTGEFYKLLKKQEAEKEGD